VYEDQNNPNCQPAGISGSVCVNHLWPVVAGGGGMTKDEALDLALAALECFDYPAHDDDVNKIQAAITAIKQARALDKMAENARELGLDYEPVGLIDRLKHPEDHYEFTDPKKANAVLMSLCQEAADALAAPVQPMAHIVGEIDHTGKVWKPVQPAVPDAMTSADIQESIEYVAGWNDCRQAMLEMMK
jgi:hypothetical protein